LEKLEERLVELGQKEMPIIKAKETDATKSDKKANMPAIAAKMQ